MQKFFYTWLLLSYGSFWKSQTQHTSSKCVDFVLVTEFIHHMKEQNIKEQTASVFLAMHCMAAYVFLIYWTSAKILSS